MHAKEKEVLCLCARKENGILNRKKGVATRKRIGLTDILEWVGRESGIDKSIRESLGEGETEKILTLARYLVATNGQPLPEIEGWLRRHPAPYGHQITEDIYPEFPEYITMFHQLKGLQPHVHLWGV